MQSLPADLGFHMSGQEDVNRSGPGLHLSAGVRSPDLDGPDVAGFLSGWI